MKTGPHFKECGGTLVHTFAGFSVVRCNQFFFLFRLQRASNALNNFYFRINIAYNLQLHHNKITHTRHLSKTQ